MDDGAFGIFLIAVIITFIIGALIDGVKGGLWGLFLGPLGWIIAAILKESNKGAPIYNYINTLPSEPKEKANIYVKNSAPSLVTQRFDKKKWDVLKEVDSDISYAAKRVSALDPGLEYELAEKYLVLGQREYLEKIVDATIEAWREKRAEDEKKRQFLQEKYSNSAMQEVTQYEKLIGEKRFDEQYGSVVKDVQVYDGSWVGWKGGIVITLEDGRTVLKNKGLSRVFGKDDYSWR